LGASALAAPLVSSAQQPTAKVARIGFLGADSASSWSSLVQALREGLRDLGYVEGKNTVIDFRWAEGKNERLPELAAELVRLKVDVLVTYGAPGIGAARRATATIPIVMAASGDAVAAGHIASLERPGGNVTGSTFFGPQLWVKKLELLKDALPHTGQVAFLLNAENAANVANFPGLATAARLLKVDLQKFEVRASQDLSVAFSAMAKQRVKGVAMTHDSLFESNLGTIADLAAQQRLPAIGPPGLANAGGLMGHGVSLPGMFRRAAYFVDRILKGTKPTDLPVEQATKFELVINMKAAKALGITIPQSILVRADRVIE